MRAQLVENSDIKRVEACEHCHEPVITPFTNEKNELFCCSGCQQVYAIINGHDLQYFYTIQKNTDSYTRPLKERSHQEYSYLDSSENKLRYEKKHSEDELSLSFYVEGIHCIACLWLIEHLPQVSKDIFSSRLDMEKSIVTVHYSKNTTPSFIAESLFKLGYRPFPIESLDEAKQLQRKEEQKDLIRIGVSLACSMNIMLYSLGVYAGASENFISIFNKLSLILSLPIISYCALPFFKSAFYALKSFKINLDVPLSFSIITGFVLSTYYVLIGSDIHYFDSLSVLVMLLLLSRYILKKVHQGHVTTSGLSELLVSGRAQKVNSDQSLTQVEPNEVLENDLLYIAPGSQVPIDGVVYRGKSKVDTSLLTGESQLVTIKEDDLVYHGYQNIDEELFIKCKTPFSKTKLSQMIFEAEKESNTKPSLLQLTDRLSHYFIAVVLFTFVAAVLYLSFAYNLDIALKRSLALVIVACPCALGLATPLAFSRGLRLASQRGIIIKNDFILEALSKTEQIFFDKTGTLTMGAFQVSNMATHHSPQVDYTCEDIIFSLEKNGQHPIAKAIVSFLADSKVPMRNVNWQTEVTQTRFGVTSTISNTSYIIETIESNQTSYKVVLKEDDKTIASLTLQDDLREDVERVMEWLSYEEYQLHILSGDFSNRLKLVTAPIKHFFSNIIGGLTPSDKANIIAQSEHSLMIGDGANDSLAFTKANVSVAMNGSLESSINISDVYLTNTGILPIKEMLMIAKGTLSTIKRNLALSLIYNSVGAILALAGYIGPLEAAIIMPISSLTVLLSTLTGTKEMRELKGAL